MTKQPHGTTQKPRRSQSRTSGYVVALVLGTCTAVSADSRPDILLVTVDTLRPDALGWVSGRQSTPHLDRLAERGFRFPAAVAPTPLTLPSHASLMTGLVPRRHGVRDNGQVVGGRVTVLAQRLQAAGWSTAAFVSGLPLSSQFGLARGFDRYDDTLDAGEGAWLERRAPGTTDAALAWLESSDLRTPWFLWVHYYDPHLPYEPPAELAGSDRRGSYDGEVALVDREAGRLLATARSRSSDLLTLFAADHGESLGEHGEASHGFFIYDSTVLVPMVIAWPGAITPGRSDAPARLIDVAPTLLDLLDLAPLDAPDGVSLRAVLEGGPVPELPAFLETRQPWTSYGWSPLKALRHGGWKLVVAPRPELYDLERDSAELENIVDERREQATRLRALLREVEARPTASAATSDDPEILARLEALGYLGGGGDASEPPPDAPDPKDRLAIRELLTEADESARSGRPADALSSYAAVLAQEPDNRFALSRSAALLIQTGQIIEARERLERVTSLSPQDAESRGLLAELLTQSGDPSAAVPHWLELVRLQPGRVTAWSNLGAALGMTNQLDRAITAFEQAAELEPEVADRWVRLAFSQFAAGRKTVAAASFLRAAGLTGEAAFAHPGALGLVLVELGRNDEARPWLGRSRRHEGEFPHARLALARLEAQAGSTEAARRALAEALAADPRLRAEVLRDPLLGPLAR